MSKLVLVSSSIAVLGLLALGASHANAADKVPVQFAVKTTSGGIAAPVRTADFNSTDRQNLNVQPVWYGRGYYGGRGWYGGGYGPRYAYRPYYVNRPYYAYRPFYGYGAPLYSSYYPPYYNYTYFRAPYYASPPVYFGYPGNVYYAPTFATYGNAYYW